MMARILSLLVIFCTAALLLPEVYAQQQAGRQLMQQAEALMEEGRYIEASEMLEKALANFEKSVGENHLDTAASLQLLIEVFDESRRPRDFDVPGALARVYAIYDKLLKEDDKRFIAALDDYAAALPAPADKVPLYKRKVEIMKQQFGDKGYDTGLAMRELADVYRKLGRTDEAEALYVQAGEANALDLSPLAGQPDVDQESLDEMQQAVQMLNEMMTANSLKTLYEENGRDEEADSLEAAMQDNELYSEIKKMEDLADELIPDAESIAREQDPDVKREKTRQRARINATLFQNFELERVYDFKLQYGLSFLQNQSPLIALALEDPEDDKTIRIAFDAVMGNKSMFLASAARREALYLNEGDASITKLLAKRETLSRQIATRAAAETPGADQNAPNRELDILMEQRGRVDAELEAWAIENIEEKEEEENFDEEDDDDLLSAFKQYLPKESAYLAEVLQTLPAKSALIEFVRYTEQDSSLQFVNSLEGISHYAAFVVDGDKAVRAVELGEAGVIDALITKYRKEVNLYPSLGGVLKGNAKQRLKGITNQLYKLLIEPLGIQTEKTLFVSLYGNLHMLPLETLTTPTGRPMIDIYTINYINSGRDLLSFSESKKQGDLYVFADANFEGTANSAVYQTTSGGEDNAVRSSDWVQQPFERLPGTAEEAAAIGSLFGLDGQHVFLQDKATEQQLINIKNPWRLHIATHGYFLEDQAQQTLDKKIAEEEDEAQLSALIAEKYDTYESPLLRSGLILAGANKTGNGQDAGHFDGIATAFELANMNLQGTDMVVLSACETGLGDVVNSEGVYGLQRAFQMAGAQSVVMSLWKVTDISTRELMVNFYSRLNKGEPKTTALRNAALDLKKKPEFEHPYFWGAFVLTGNPN